MKTLIDFKIRYMLLSSNMEGFIIDYYYYCINTFFLFIFYVRFSFSINKLMNFAIIK